MPDCCCRLSEDLLLALSAVDAAAAPASTLRLLDSVLSLPEGELLADLFIRLKIGHEINLIIIRNIIFLIYKWLTECVIYYYI